MKFTYWVKVLNLIVNQQSGQFFLGHLRLVVHEKSELLVGHVLVEYRKPLLQVAHCYFTASIQVKELKGSLNFLWSHKNSSLVVTRNSREVIEGIICADAPIDNINVRLLLGWFAHGGFGYAVNFCFVNFTFSKNCDNQFFSFASQVI